MPTFLDKITPDVIREFNNGIQKTFIDPINITVTDLDDTNKGIASHLLEEGITPEQIIHFVDVSKAQLEPYLADKTKEKEIEARLRKKIEAEIAEKASL